MTPLICLCALLALCVAGTELTQATPEETGAVEHLLGLQVDAEGVVFQVFSSGCTAKEDFRIERFQRHQSNTFQLILIREKQDPCDAVLPYGRTIRYSYEDLGLENGQIFFILNPTAPVKVVKSSRP